MAERDQYELLNDAVDAILARQTASSFEPELAPLLMIAADLRDMPDPQFRQRLAERLFGKEDSMKTAVAVQSIRPYQIVRTGAASDHIAFIERVFGATLLLRVPRPDGMLMHAELQLGDSIIEIADANDQWSSNIAPLHVYVDDVDAVYGRAMAAGATSLYEPVDQPYSLREAGFRDAAGVEWFVANPKPAEHETVTPALRVNGASRLLTFLREVLDTTELSRDESAGRVVYSATRAGRSTLEISDAHGAWGATSASLHVFVDDPDTIYERALAFGSTSLMPPADQPYGERNAGVVDEFGNRWFFARKLS